MPVYRVSKSNSIKKNRSQTKRLAIRFHHILLLLHLYFLDWGDFETSLVNFDSNEQIAFPRAIFFKFIHSIQFDGAIGCFVFIELPIFVECGRLISIDRIFTVDFWENNKKVSWKRVFVNGLFTQHCTMMAKNTTKVARAKCSRKILFCVPMQFLLLVFT